MQGFAQRWGQELRVSQPPYCLSHTQNPQIKKQQQNDLNNFGLRKQKEITNQREFQSHSKTWERAGLLKTVALTFLRRMSSHWSKTINMQQVFTFVSFGDKPQSVAQAIPEFTAIPIQPLEACTTTPSLLGGKRMIVLSLAYNQPFQKLPDSRKTRVEGQDHIEGQAESVSSTPNKNCFLTPSMAPSYCSHHPLP